ncbi:hypothetical protein BLN97_18570 [Bradyrhizobium elkanii]|nr:hypothetical protein BLN97_18570 [Bradyrhizobium elkanii]
MPAGSLPAGIVEQPLRDVLPDCVAAIQSDCIGCLDFDDPLAAAARYAKDVTPNVRQTPLPYLASVVSARGSLSTDSQYSAGSGASGAAAGGAGLWTASAASFSICFGVGLRQLAGRSVMPN